MGFEAHTKGNLGNAQYPYVLFAAPPSGSDDYPAEV